MSELTKTQEQKMRTKAKQADQQARKLQAEVTSKPWDLAFLAAGVKRDELWRYMATTYTRIKEWYSDIGVAKATFHQGVRLVEELHYTGDVPKAELRKMSMANAEWLRKLPRDERRKPDMWKKAQTMTEDAFLEVVNTKRKENGDEPDDGRTNLKVRCYVNQADFIRSVLEKFAEQHGLGNDYGRALELAMAEVHSTLDGGKSFVGRLKEGITAAAFELAQLKSITDAIRAEYNGDKSGEEILLEVSKQLDPLENGLVKAVDALAAITKNMGKKHGDLKVKTEQAAAAGVGH